MNTPTQIVILAVITAILPGLIMILNERRLRRIAEARLELTKCATWANHIMLTGETKLGEICHDHVCKQICSAQHNQRFNVYWNPFMPNSAEAKAFRKQLDKELQSNKRMREVLRAFYPNVSKAFRNSHPLTFVVFSTWVLLFCGGIGMLIVALKVMVSSARGLMALSDWWTKQKYEIAEWCVVYGRNSDWMPAQRV